MPEISVVIPVYNRGSLIKLTVDSVLQQALLPASFEIIIVDDGSTDNTLEFIRATYESVEQIRIISQPNMGVAEARNTGLREARGEFIAYLDHDDQWFPGKLRIQRDAFEAFREIDVVYCSWTEVDESGVPLPEELQSINLSRWKPVEGNVYDAFIPFNLIISMSVPLIRTEVLRQVGGFDSRAAPADDWDLWLRLARCCRFKYVDHALVLYQHHAQQQSTDSERMDAASLRVLASQVPFLWAKPAALYKTLQRIRTIKYQPSHDKAKRALFDADFIGFRRLLFSALIHNPRRLFSKKWVYLMWRSMKKDTRPY